MIAAELGKVPFSFLVLFSFTEKSEAVRREFAVSTSCTVQLTLFHVSVMGTGSTIPSKDLTVSFIITLTSKLFSPPVAY